MSSNAGQKKANPKQLKSMLISIGSIIILVIAAVSFVFLPAMVSRGARDTHVLGYFRKEPIKRTDEVFLRMLENQIEQNKMQGIDVNDQGNYLSILYSAFSETIIHKAFKYEVEKTGFKVPESAINRVIVNKVTDTSGVYSPKLYNQMSNAKKIELRKQVAEDFIFEQYFNDFLGFDPYGYPTEHSSFGLKISSEEIPFILNMNSPERTFEFVAFSMSEFPTEQLLKFAESHAVLFNTVNFEIITVSSKTEAEKISKRIANNEITFDDAIKEYSNKNFSDDKGVLSNNNVYQLKKLLSEEDLEVVLQLGIDSISNVIATGHFFSIFKCCDTSKSADFSNPETLNNVYSYITTEEPKLIEDYFTAKARDFAADASVSSFDAACEKYGVIKQTPSAFSLNYGSNELLSAVDTDTPVLAGAATNENFLKTAFSLKLNEISSPVLLKNNVLVIKLVAEQDVDEEILSAISFFYPISAKKFDSATISAYFTTADYVKNDVVSAYLSMLDE